MKTIAAFLTAAACATALAAPASADRRGTPIACDIASKEFAGPPTLRNTSGHVLTPGTRVFVTVKTATGKESSVVVVHKYIAKGEQFKGTGAYQNTMGCTAMIDPRPIYFAPKQS